MPPTTRDDPAGPSADAAPVDGRTVRRQRGRAAVIAAVVDLLTEGHVPPTTAEVVARAGISEATLFRNFGRIDDLQLEASITFLDRHTHRFEIPDLGHGPLDARIDRLVRSRTALWEAIGPVVRLGRARAVDNPELADLLRTSRLAQIDQARTHFAAELTGLTPTRRTHVAAVVTSLTGFEAWDLLRHDLASSHRRIHQTWTSALTALLDPTGPTKSHQVHREEIPMTNWTHPDVEQWASRGTLLEVSTEGATYPVFVVDVPAGTDAQDPLVVIHGFPTSSFDFAPVVDHLSRDRRVVLMDLLGFGLSAKPDRRYSIELQADVVAGVLAHLELDRFALLTHDMGDTVGGELLARTIDGSWPATVTRRLVTNGSIYIGMAQLTAGQLMLLDLPDAVAEAGPGPELLAASLGATLAPAYTGIDMSGHAELVCHDGGDALLPRTIRYIEDRRANESRYTGSIETHPSPLHVIWGPEDPIAVPAMAERLVSTRPDATLTWIPNAGHYPQLEDPIAWLSAVTTALTQPPTPTPTPTPDRF